jgi:hypothetical protein
VEGEPEFTDDSYSLFIYAMKSPETRRVYVRRPKRFFEFLGLQGPIEERCKAFAERVRSDINWAFGGIVTYLQHRRQRVEKKEIAAATLRNHVKTIRLFCEMADIEIRWKKITRGFPRSRKFADDRAPTIDELRAMTQYLDRRIKAIAYTMAFSGIRLGVWDYLRWGHIRPIERNGRLVAARLTVYAGEEDQYFTFITPEAYRALESWMEYRRSCGEPITEKSLWMLDLWDGLTPTGAGMVMAPKRLKATGVKRLAERTRGAPGIRKKLEHGQKLHESQADYGMRKWFKTRCEIAGIKPIKIK